MKYTISKIYFNKTNKDGQPYKDGTTLISLILEGVEQKLSFFDNDNKFSNLTIGSTIEGTVVQKGQYWNFEPEGSSSKKTFAGKGSSDFENVAMKKLDMIVHQNNTIIALLQGASGAAKAAPTAAPIPEEGDGLDFLTA